MPLGKRSLLAIALLAALPAVSSAATVYDVSGIAPLSGDDLTTAYAINNNNQVIGLSVAANLAAFVPGSGISTKSAITDENGFLLTGSTPAVLPPLGTTASGLSLALPAALNDSGEVVGASPVAAGTSGSPNQAFIYDAGVTTNLANIVGGALSSAVGVNNQGDVIGTFRQDADSGPAAQPFLYNGTSVQVLGTLSGTSETIDSVYGINNSGTIIGGATTTGSTSPQAITFNGSTFQILPNLSGATITAPLAINSLGNIAGWSGPEAPSGSTPVTTINLTQQTGLTVLLGLSPLGLAIGEGSEYEVGDAFYYNASTKKMTNIGTLGGGFSAAFGLNDDGDIVGMSLTSQGNYNAFLYDNSTLTMTNLNTILPKDSGWTLLSANGINNAGDIVGFGDFNGSFEGYVLSPSGTISGTGGTGGTGGSTTAVPLPPATMTGIAMLTALSATSFLKKHRTA
jgi:probable HAF family extracellular repeat protein